jgi:hypothetical protein
MKFNWKQMGGKLVQKLLKISWGLWSWKNKKLWKIWKETFSFLFTWESSNSKGWLWNLKLLYLNWVSIIIVLGTWALSCCALQMMINFYLFIYDFNNSSLLMLISDLI